MGLEITRFPRPHTTWGRSTLAIDVTILVELPLSFNSLLGKATLRGLVYLFLPQESELSPSMPIHFSGNGPILNIPQ
ncbi:hypothetical protein GCM10011389_39800 [Pontibacillus salipaludis]|uniref:Uncharacterized protein n=1 Tax=Pontibacillus salipaludis TaxID=1697394 RepID=A0ABQ1QJ02_9BACI|nr:hypothetical protein GCM10011389_39800 [Pontibacillus salipaludis]